MSSSNQDQDCHSASHGRSPQQYSIRLSPRVVLLNSDIHHRVLCFHAILDANRNLHLRGTVLLIIRRVTLQKNRTLQSDQYAPLTG